MDGVVIERTRPRLVSRCGLREDRNCLYRRATLLDESADHMPRMLVASKLLLNINTITRRGRVRPSTRVRASRRARPRAWSVFTHFRRARGVCPRVYAMRRDFVERERHPHTCTSGQRARPRPHAHGAPGPHDRASPVWRVPTAPHHGGSAKPTAHCAAAHAHSHTDTTSRPGGDCVDGGNSKTTRRALHRPAT